MQMLIAAFAQKQSTAEQSISIARLEQISAGGCMQRALVRVSKAATLPRALGSR